MSVKPQRRSWRSAAFALLALCFAIGGTIWWREGGRNRFIPRNWDAVVPGFLYRSGQIDARLVESVLREHQIHLVIDLARDRWGDADARAERAAIERLGIRRLGSERLDGSGRGDPASYVDALAAIAEAQRNGQRVLIHCSAGSERTGGVVMLYRTLYQGWSGGDAYAEYLRYRNRLPKSSRVAHYLDDHVAEIAAALVARGALSSLPGALPRLAPSATPAEAGRPQTPLP